MSTMTSAPRTSSRASLKAPNSTLVVACLNFTHGSKKDRGGRPLTDVPLTARHGVGIKHWSDRQGDAHTDGIQVFVHWDNTWVIQPGWHSVHFRLKKGDDRADARSNRDPELLEGTARDLANQAKRTQVWLDKGRTILMPDDFERDGAINVLAILRFTNAGSSGYQLRGQYAWGMSKSKLFVSVVPSPDYREILCAGYNLVVLNVHPDDDQLMAYPVDDVSNIERASASIQRQLDRLQRFAPDSLVSTK